MGTINGLFILFLSFTLGVFGGIPYGYKYSGLS
jgi:hypothetical protein